jgi:hypothetical protein
MAPPAAEPRETLSGIYPRAWRTDAAQRSSSSSSRQLPRLLPKQHIRRQLLVAKVPASDVIVAVLFDIQSFFPI